MKRTALATCLALAVAAACGAPKAIPADELVKDLDAYLGKRVTVKTRFKSGARCRIGEEGEWKTYCKDCQYCRGPLVFDVPGTETSSAGDWPVILGGTWELKDIRCKGPLNKVECWPFTPGKTYVVRGKLEHQRPARLLVEEYWDVKD